MNLADMIEVYTTNVLVDSTEDMSIADIKAENSGWTKLGTLTDYLNQESYVIEGSLTTKTSAPRTIALHMIEEAGNEYQDCELGNIYIVFEAKQDTVEEDAFDNQYDEDALWHDGWDGSIDTAWYDNAAEGATEFILSSPSELAGLAQLVNAGNDFDNITIKLGADMNLGNRLWTPIGKHGAAFNGTLDGDGHVISNLKIVQKDTAYCGLVGKATTYAELKNITIDGANIDACKYVGAILGHGYASIFNCTVKNAKISATDPAGEEGDKAGAIVGYRAEGKSLKFIGNTAENVEIVANRQAGQLVGYMQEYKAEKDYGNEAINVTVMWSGYGSNENVNQRLYGAGTGSEATE